MDYLFRLFIVIISLKLCYAPAPTVTIQSKKGDGSSPSGTSGTPGLCTNLKNKFDGFAAGGTGYTTKSDPNFAVNSRSLSQAWLSNIPN